MTSTFRRKVVTSDFGPEVEIPPFLRMYNEQEAQLPQRDRATMLVNSCRFTSHGRYKGFKQQKLLSMSFNGIGNGAIRLATYDFLFCSLTFVVCRRL